ncbi:unnamed protein product [Orchesella dallaii]|uniref:C2H2-type domain-containing protein n=1 Tax=Orchesella dallaii TaxID=48710 RepID=A0ABP1SAE4_9HEXA
MKPSVCLVCLRTFDGDDLASEEGNAGAPFDVPLLTRFLKFAENYLNLSSVTTQQLLLSGSDRKEAFCEKCLLKRKQALPDVLLSPLFEEAETVPMENDEVSFQDNLEHVYVEPSAREAIDMNSFDLKPANPGPIGTVIQFKTFKQDSNPELIFENENDEEIEDLPSAELTISSLAVFPVAEKAVLRINGVNYNNGRRCPRCSKVLRSEPQYHIHYRYHHLNIACNSCGKTFGNQKSWREHSNRCHKRQGVYRCEVCSKVFETAFRLTAHMRNVHDNKNRPYPCTHCNAAFKYLCNLEQHIGAIHKPGNYKCPHCPQTESKTFTTDKYLRGHIRRVHPQVLMFPPSANNVLYGHVASSESYTSAEMCDADA